MAELSGGSTIAGYPAIHSGMALVSLTGKVSVGGVGPASSQMHINQGTGNGLTIEDGDGTANQRMWRIEGGNNILKIQALNDAGGWLRDIIMIGHDGTIGSVGNFGVGTNTPTFPFHVHKTGDVWHAMMGDNAAGVIRMGGNTAAGGAVIQSIHNVTGVVRNLSLQRDGGNVGIGVATPTQKLDVAGSVKLGVGSAIIASYNNGAILMDHGNAAVTLSSAGGELYLGYINTSNVRVERPLRLDIAAAARLVIPVGTDKYAT